MILTATAIALMPILDNPKRDQDPITENPVMFVKGPLDPPNKQNSLLSKKDSSTNKTIQVGDQSDSAGNVVVQGFQFSPTMPATFSFAQSDSFKKLSGMDRLVKFSGNNIGMKEVTDFLKRMNVNFVIAEKSMPKDRFSMNLENVPLHEALNAIADALGGRWSTRGNVLTFHSGLRNVFTPAGQRGRDVEPGSELQIRAWTQKHQLELEKMKKELSDLEFNFDGARINEWAKMKDIAPLLQRREQELMEKSAKEFSLNLQEKHLEKVKESLEKIKIAIPPNVPRDFKKFVQSLTPAQKDLMKKQGYLKFSDLTSDQLKMMNISKSASEVHIIIQENGERIEIRNK